MIHHTHTHTQIHPSTFHSKKNIRKEACWTLSNVTAGTAEQIQSVINACVFPKLIQLLGSSEFDIQVIHTE
jgi:importin subunit alpha-6/7